MHINDYKALLETKLKEFEGKQILLYGAKSMISASWGSAECADPTVKVDVTTIDHFVKEAGLCRGDLLR